MNTANNHGFRALAFAVSALTLTGVGCVEPNRDLNRVQPNYTDKQDIEGEWYARALIVDKDYLTSFPFVGFEWDLERVRFEVAQNMLMAYRSYERVPGTEAANPGEQALIASFPIQSHFDIRREYNPVNGVESNVISENDFDRPWYERDYMRIDWSRNLTDNMGFTLNGYVNVLFPQTVVDNANANPTDPYKVRMEDTDGDGEIDYIETTVEALAQASPYACWAMAGENGACPSTTARLKWSFMKVKERNYEEWHYNDFEPVKYGLRVNLATQALDLCFEGDSGCLSQSCYTDDGVQIEGCTAGPDELWLADGPFGSEICDPARHNPDNCFQWTIPLQSKFGYFRTDRFVYDRENGYTYDARQRLINRWNTWVESYDADGNLIPMAERTPKPIVYTLNVGFPESLKAATQEMADDWDVAFRDTIAKAQGIELDDVVSQYCPAFPADAPCVDSPRMFIIEENNCNVQSVNDYVDQHMDRHDFGADLSRHGIGNVGLGNLEQSCAVLEHYSREMAESDPLFPVFRWQQLGDLRYSFINMTQKAELGGPLGYGPSAADPLTGEIISANANVYGASLDTYANWGGDIVQLLNGELTTEDIMNGTHIREHIQSVRSRFADKKMNEARISKFIGLFDERTAHMSEENYLKEIPAHAINENLKRLAESGFQQEYLVDNDTLMLMNPGNELNPSMDLETQVTDEMVNRALPSNWARRPVPPLFRQNVQNSSPHAANWQMPAMPSGDEVPSVLEQYQAREEFLAANTACFSSEMVEPAVADLAADLEGKTRDEAIAFIRANIYRGVMAHEVGHTLGLRHNFEGSSDALNFFPGYWGVETGDHRDSHNNRRDEMRYSSIMDYHQRFNGDWGGIGLYDKAAIKFGYGKLVEVFDEGRFDSALNGYEDPFVPRDWDTNLSLFAPSDLPYLMAGGTANDEINTHYDEVIDDLIGGNPDAYLDIQTLNITPNASNLYKRKDITFAEFKRQEVQRIWGIQNADGSPPAVEVPYSYCSDLYAWGGNLTCNRWDMGTTSEEIVNNVWEMYEFYYPFQQFRGQKLWMTGGEVNSYIGRLYDRTYQPMLNSFRYFYYYRRSTASIWPLIRDWSAAAFVGMNFFTRVLQTPEPGRYCLDDGKYRPESLADTCDTGSTFAMPMGEARYYDTTWTTETLFRPNTLGHVYDKLIALQAMTTTDAFFFRDFSNLFSRGAFSIGYYRVFQPEVLEFFRSVISGDGNAYTPEVVINGKPQLVYKPLVELPGEEFVSQGTPIEPTDSYYMQYYALFFGFANLSSQYDLTLDFKTRSRISLLGKSNDPDLQPVEDVEEIVVVDPLTNYVYQAASIDGPDVSIGYSLLKELKDLTNDGTDGDEGAWHVANREYETARQALEDAEANETGDLDALQDTLTDKQIAKERADRLVNEKVQIIDAIRELSDAYEFGI